MFLRKTCFRIPIIFVVMTIPVFRRRQSNKKNERPTRSRPLSHPCNLRNSWTNFARGERCRTAYVSASPNRLSPTATMLPVRERPRKSTWAEGRQNRDCRLNKGCHLSNKNNSAQWMYSQTVNASPNNPIPRLVPIAKQGECPYQRAFRTRNDTHLGKPQSLCMWPSCQNHST